MTRTLAVEWAQHGIRVNAICPGYFHTALTDDLLSVPEQRERLLRRIPDGTPGSTRRSFGSFDFFTVRGPRAHLLAKP